MPYYPKSQIKTNLYTSGNEYSLVPPDYATYQPPYIGPYYLLYNRQAFTGNAPSNVPSQKLFPLNAILGKSFNITSFDPSLPTVYVDYSQLNSLSLSYSKIKSPQTPKERLLPYYTPVLPTSKDYQLGVFIRYFCKKNNEPKYIEIDKKIYNLLKSKSSNIAWDLYSPILTSWYLVGKEINVAKINKGLISQIERTQNWYGFSQYFKGDFSKYYVES